MTRKMLINAQTPEELRIAIVDNNRLENFQIESAERDMSRLNVYQGTVTNVVPSLNAAFVNYGAAKDGFLPLHDIHPSAYHKTTSKKHPRIEDVMERGKPIVVQVLKEPEGNKGAALTANVSLAGRYLVFTPFDDTRGVSRKVEDEDVRQKLKQMVSSLKIPKGSGFIVRTNAVGQTKTTLSRDLSALVRVWKRITGDAKKARKNALLYSDQDLIVRVMRDYLDPTVDEIIIDDDAAFEKATEYVKGFMPRTKMQLTRYDERAPLFARYDIDRQIDRIFQRVVPLPGGGSLVIDRTEALWAIDINTGKSKAGSQDETILQTNLQAAEEIARQLRLRDIGGLVVVDFIDMRSNKDRNAVEKTLRDAMKSDKARSTIGRISENGLLEINRQRIQQALNLRLHRICPTCDGTGRIASPEMIGLDLLRRIAARASDGTVSGVRIELHPEIADAFQNKRRQEIAALEKDFNIRVEVVASYRLHRPEQEIEWLDRDQKLVETPQPAAQERKVSPPHHPVAVEESRESKRSRRRRKGRHRLQDEPIPSSQPQPPLSAIPQLEPDPEQPEAAEPGGAHFFVWHGDDETESTAPAEVPAEREPARRRRRRGRRRESIRPVLEPFEIDEADVFPEDPETPPTPAEPQAAMNEAVVEESHPREGGASRRRGRRRRRGNGSKPAVAAEESREVAPAEAEVVVENAAEAAPAPTEPKRRGKRRRRRGGSGAAEAVAEATTTESETPAAAPAATAAPKRPKRRRRRRPGGGASNGIPAAEHEPPSE